MTYRSRLALWASAVAIASAAHGPGQSQTISNTQNSTQSWSNPPVPLIQEPRRVTVPRQQAQPDQRQPAVKSQTVSPPPPKTAAKAPPRPVARCMQLAASQSGVGQAATLAQARDKLEGFAFTEAGRRGWPSTLVRVSETQRCEQQFFLPLFGLGYDCTVRASFCAR